MSGRLPVDGLVHPNFDMRCRLGCHAVLTFPESSAALAAGDLLIVIGEREALIRLAQAASSEGG